jgi:hypothetical protein
MLSSGDDARLTAMRKVIFGLIALAALGAWPLSVGAESQFGDPNAEPEPFHPHMGALMSMLIQPRHAKLGLAGHAENWPLAAYALKELKQGFAVVAKSVPRFRGAPVASLIESSVEQPLTVIDFAIKLKFRTQFNDGFAQLTAGCNACHTSTDHPFVVIKVPETSAFPDQDFVPKP